MRNFSDDIADAMVTNPKGQPLKNQLLRLERHRDDLAKKLNKMLALPHVGNEINKKGRTAEVEKKIHLTQMRILNDNFRIEEIKQKMQGGGFNRQMTQRDKRLSYACRTIYSGKTMKSLADTGVQPD